MTDRWRALPVGARVALVALAAVVALNLFAAVLEQTVGGGGEPSGPPGSSYTTASDGLAAYADLLADRDHPVTRIRRPLEDADLDADSTLVVVGSGRLPPDDRAAVEAFVSGGGRLVVVGSAGDGLLEFTGSNVDWSPGGVESAAVLAPAPETRGISSVQGSGTGSWADPSGLLPVVGAGKDVVVAVGRFGAGRVVAVADQGMLENRLLADADNAALGLAIAGEPARPVQFAEFHHGYGVSDGLGAIPRRWRIALIGLLIAALIGMWAWGKRLGPAQAMARELPPARVENVHALAASLARTSDRGAVVSRLQRAARDRLSRRAGLPAVYDDASVRAAAQRAGLSPEEAEAVLRPDASDHAAMAAGTVLARLESER